MKQQVFILPGYYVACKSFNKTLNKKIIILFEWHIRQLEG